MINIQNTDAINAIRNGAKLSISEGFPQQLIRSVQPVMDMTPAFHKKANITRSVTAAGTIYTTPNDSEFYLIGILLSTAHAALDTGTAASVTANIDGVSRTLATIAAVNGELTGNQTIYIDLSKCPILIDRNAAIALSIAGGWSGVRSIIYGYINN